MNDAGKAPRSIQYREAAATKNERKGLAMELKPARGVSRACLMLMLAGALSMVGTSAGSLYMVDRHIGKRGAS